MRNVSLRVWLLAGAVVLGGWACGDDDAHRVDAGCDGSECGEGDAAQEDDGGAQPPKKDAGTGSQDADPDEDAATGDDAGPGEDAGPDEDAAPGEDAGADGCAGEECPPPDCGSDCPAGPSAGFSLSASSGVIPLVVRATSSAQPGDAPIASIRYDFTGAGFADSDSHRYAGAGEFVVRQQVRDENGLIAVASLTVSVADFQPVRWSATDHDPLVFLSPDRMMVENRGEDRGGARSDRALAPGSGVFYFEAERLIDETGVWGVGVATASADLTQQIGSSAQSLGIDTYGQVNNTGATCSGSANFGANQRHYGFVVDYRGSSPKVHVLLEDTPHTPVVQRSCTTTLSAPLFIAYAGVRYVVGYQLGINAGSDLTNFPFYYAPGAVRAALTSAGLADAAAALVPGFGQTRSPVLDAAPQLVAPADRTLALGSQVSLSASASDAEDGDLSASIVWTVQSSQHHAPVTGTGSTFSFTPGALGTHPISVSVTDSDGVTTERVVKVVATGALPQSNPVRLAPDALSGPGITLSSDGLSARFDGFGKYGIRANQPIYGRYWYFEAHRLGGPGNMGVGLIIGDGAINPYDFVNVPWSCSINFTGNSWRNLISQANWSPSESHYGFAVDYRDVHPKVYIIVGGALHLSMQLDDVWVPLYPMTYGNPQESTAPAMDVTLNFGASAFQFNPRTILSGAGIDTTGLELGWGDANTP